MMCEPEPECEPGLERVLFENYEPGLLEGFWIDDKNNSRGVRDFWKLIYDLDNNRYLILKNGVLEPYAIDGMAPITAEMAYGVPDKGFQYTIIAKSLFGPRGCRRPRPLWGVWDIKGYAEVPLIGRQPGNREHNFYLIFGTNRWKFITGLGQNDANNLSLGEWNITVPPTDASDDYTGTIYKLDNTSFY